MNPSYIPVRYQVLALTVCLSAITYLDRSCISVTAPQIMRELSLSRFQMSLVFSAFTLAYGLFEIPTGWWGDRIGTRKVLTRIVVWWSTFTIATAAAGNYISLLIIRFLFGMGEAGAWPNAARTFSRWFPTAERGTAQGIFFMGAHLGGGLTPALVTLMLTYFHWRATFVIFGAIGFVWAAAWYGWFRDDPEQHTAISKEELLHIQKGRWAEAGHHMDRAVWRRLWKHRGLRALCLMYGTQSYGFYFYITWLPTYLLQARGLTGARLSILAGLPLVLSVIADLFGGLTTDRITQRFGLRAGRCAVGGGALLAAGLFVILGARVEQPVMAAVFIALAAAASNFLLGASWGVCLDIAGPHAGVVSACMNTAGQIGGFLSPIVLAIVSERFADWAAPLYIIGALYWLGAACWWWVDPHQPILAGDVQSSHTLCSQGSPPK